MEPSGSGDSAVSRLQRMTRSLSFKIPAHLGGKKHTNETPRTQPKKIDADNWLRGKPAQQQTRKQEAPPSNITLFNSVGDKKSLWASKVENHNLKQALNPFSEKFDKSLSRNMLNSKDDPNYGRPEANSLSSLRAKAGEAKMRAEICDVCDVIYTHGQRSADGTAAIRFGPLFSIYNRINDKLVGLLIRARKRELLTFEGEMLYQRRDNETWVVLTKNINTIHALFGRDMDIPGGGEVDPEVVEGMASSRRSSVVSLPATLHTHITDCASLLGSTAMGVLGLGGSLPENQEQHLDQQQPQQQHPDQRHRQQPQASLAPGPHHRSLKESFRKLVRPLVKRRGDLEAEDSANSTDEETGSIWRDFSRRNSRRDSRQSAGGRHQTPEKQSSRGSSFRLHGRRWPEQQEVVGSLHEEAAAQSAVAAVGEGDQSSSIMPLDSRWRKILGISLAISRMSQMAGRRSGGGGGGVGHRDEAGEGTPCRDIGRNNSLA